MIVKRKVVPKKSFEKKPESVIKAESSHKAQQEQEQRGKGAYLAMVIFPVGSGCVSASRSISSFSLVICETTNTRLLIGDINLRSNMCSDLERAPQ